VAESSRTHLTENAYDLLLNLVNDYGRIVTGDRKALELAVRFQAR